MSDLTPRRWLLPLTLAFCLAPLGGCSEGWTTITIRRDSPDLRLDRVIVEVAAIKNFGDAPENEDQLCGRVEHTFTNTTGADVWPLEVIVVADDRDLQDLAIRATGYGGDGSSQALITAELLIDDIDYSAEPTYDLWLNIACQSGEDGSPPCGAGDRCVEGACEEGSEVEALFEATQDATNSCDTN